MRSLKLLFLCLFFMNTIALSMGNIGDWIAGTGFGVAFRPSSLLLVPQAEYVYQNNLYVGPLVQVAPGLGETLVAVSAAGRLVFVENPRLKPYVEGGLGLTLSPNTAMIIHTGMGLDYQVDRNFAVGTLVRLNLLVPGSPFVSWPLILGRFLL